MWEHWSTPWRKFITSSKDWKIGESNFSVGNYLNKQDQYSRHNNLDIQGIPDSVSDNQLEEKVIEIFNQINVKIDKFDIEDCHHMGK